MNLRWDHLGQPQRAAGVLADFPQSGQFSQAPLVLARLRDALPSGRPPARCEIVDVRYVAGRSLQVVYRLFAALDAPGETDAPGTLVAVRFLRPGRSADAWHATRLAAADPSAVLHLPDWEAIAWRLPEDETLAPLPALLGRVDARGGPPGGRVAPLQLPAGLPGLPDAAHCTLLAYLPGRRCAVRWDWPGRHAPVVVKAGEGAADSHRRLAALWALPGRRFRMPQPLGCDAEANARWETFDTGQALARLPAHRAAATLAAVAQALAGLHGTALDALAAQDARIVLRRFERKAMPRIAQALPALADGCARLHEALAAQADRLELSARPAATLHGDLHTANVLIGSDGVTFIDLDNLAHGDPAYDLALLGSRLWLGALLEQAPPGPVADAIAALPAAYAAAGGASVPERVFAWYMALLLASRQIKTCLVHLAPDLAALTGTLLAQAQATLERGRFDRGVLDAPRPDGSLLSSGRSG